MLCSLAMPTDFTFRKIPKRNIEFMDTQSKYVLFLGMNFVKGSHTMECTVSIYFIFITVKLLFLSLMTSVTVSTILPTMVSLPQHVQEAIESFSLGKGKLRCLMTFTLQG